MQLIENPTLNSDKGRFICQLGCTFNWQLIDSPTIDIDIGIYVCQLGCTYNNGIIL
jgi:hypothetical protein